MSQDAEGMQTMCTLGNNMAWILKNLKDGGIQRPEGEMPVMTNFIRQGYVQPYDLLQKYKIALAKG